MAEKRPILFSLDKGHLGRWLATEPNGDGSCTVVFTTNIKRKSGLSFAKTCYLKNVPEAAVLPVLRPPANEDGVAAEGYIMLTNGEFGNSWLRDHIQSEENRVMNILREQIKHLQIQIGALTGEKRELVKGAEEALRDIDRSRDIMTPRDKRRSPEYLPDDTPDMG